MRTLRKHVLNLLTTLSLLLCVAGVVLWVRGWRAQDYVTCAEPGVRYYVDCGGGRVEFSRAASPNVDARGPRFDAGSRPLPPGEAPRWDVMYPDDGNRVAAVVGAIYCRLNLPGLNFPVLVVPLWMIAAAAAVAPALAARRRLPRSTCRHCGTTSAPPPTAAPSAGRAGRRDRRPNVCWRVDARGPVSPSPAG
jgi:hypothetical protein